MPEATFRCNTCITPCFLKVEYLGSPCLSPPTPMKRVCPFNEEVKARWEPVCEEPEEDHGIKFLGSIDPVLDVVIRETEMEMARRMGVVFRSRQKEFLTKIGCLFCMNRERCYQGRIGTTKCTGEGSE